ncbi:MAG: DUF3168 domain-containing protein [Pseudomonadota bacterium]
MSNGRHAVLAAIYDLLMGDAALVAMLGEGRIFDRPRRHEAMPLITFGRLTTERDRSDGPVVQTHTLDMDVFGDQSRAQVSEICEIIVDHLDEVQLNAVGYKVILVRHLSTTIEMSRDLRSYRGRNRFRFLTEKLS